MQKKKIIFTVPHGCSETTPICDLNADRIAERTAEILMRELESVNITVLINRRSRMDLDMNRPESRGTLFRQMIDEAVQAEDVLLFDVHSFPNGFLKWHGVDVGVFDLPYPKDDAFTQQLTALFNQAGLKSKKIDGSQLNDIAACQKCNDNDETVLVEFNQDFDVNEAATKFASVIKKVLGERER